MTTDDTRGQGDGNDQTGAPEPLDARGLRCPLPVLKLRKRLQALPGGARLEMIADDPAARIDVPHFCNEQGHRLVTEEDAPDGAIRFVVEKKGA